MSREFGQHSVFSRGRIIGTAPEDIALAASLLSAGDLVGMPTETVYGLAADATQGEAVAAIYAAKGRPSFNPLISHVASLEQALEHGVFNTEALRLAEAFWPGPLTLVVPFRPTSAVSDLARAGLDTIALRVPSHPVARALIAQAGVPVAAPSANLSGRISPTNAHDVVADLGGKVSVVINGGPCDVGLESTIISCAGGRIVQLRPGGLSRESVMRILGREMDLVIPDATLRSPGLLESHYAPLAALRISVSEFRDDDAILAFGTIKLPEFPANRPVINLSPTANLLQAAARLFSALRELDAHKPATIAVAPIPTGGLGEAINDRLARASAPRSFIHGHS
jgi:L-threonylcarbamoyladenylate synthase